jgi:hypothetical protein
VSEADLPHLGPLLGGVFGRRPLLLVVGVAVAVYAPARAGSVALRMEKLHIRVSSTDIRAPELSNSPQ